jgi:hypothetical protein
MFQYWYSASVWVLISFSKGSICLLPNYVTNLHPNPLRIFIPVLQRYKFLGLPEIHRLKPLFRSLVKVLIFSSSSFPGWCFSHDFSLLLLFAINLLIITPEKLLCAEDAKQLIDSVSSMTI